MENEKNLDAIEDELADIALGLRRLMNSDDSFDVFVLSRRKEHTQSTEGAGMKTAKTIGETAAVTSETAVVTSQVGAITSSSWNELWAAIESNKGTTSSMPVDKMPATKQVAADSPVPVVPPTAAETPTSDDSICARKKLVAKRRLIRQKDGQTFREDKKTVAVAPVAPVMPEAPATPTMLVRPVAPVVPRDILSARKKSVAKRRLRSGRNNSSSQGDQANREAMPFSVTTPSSAPLYDAGTLTALMAWKKVVSKRGRSNNRGTGMCKAGETDNKDLQEEERENSKDPAISSKGESNENEREDKSKTKEHNSSREEDKSSKDDGASGKPDEKNNKGEGGSSNDENEGSNVEGESSKDEGKDSNKGEDSSKADEESSKDKGASGETGEENDQDRGDTSNDKGDTESDSDGKKNIEDESESSKDEGESSKDKGESSKDKGESSKTEDSSKTEENSGKDEGASDNPNKENDREKEDNRNNESSNDREESGTDERENSEDEGDIYKDEDATDRTDEGKSKDEKDDNDDDNSIKDDGGSKDGREGDKDEDTISEDGEGSGKDEEEESEDDEVELNFGKHYDWCDFVNSLDSLDFISFLARRSRCAILDIIATMLQNYEWAQNKVRSKGWLLPFISTLKNDSDDRVRIKALYAISCAVRDHADNRRDFLDNHDGLGVLFRAIQTDVPKLQIKSIFLLKSIVTSEPLACETFHSRGHGIVELLVSIAFCQNRVNYAANDVGDENVDAPGGSDNNGANNDDSSTSDSDSLVDLCFSALLTLATFNAECLVQIRRFVSPLRATQERRLERIQRGESRVADDETDAEELFRLIDEGGDNVDAISLRHCEDETDAKELFRLVEGEDDEGDDVDAISLYH